MNDELRQTLRAVDRVLDGADFDLLTVQEYADSRRVHPQTVYTSIRQGRFKLQVIRETGRAIRIAVPRGSIQTLKSA